MRSRSSLFLLILFGILFLPQTAFACLVVPKSDRQEILKDAAFIGMVKFVSVKRMNTTNPYDLVTLEVIKSYKGNLQGVIVVKEYDICNSARNIYKVGSLYEEIIKSRKSSKSNEDEIYLAGRRDIQSLHEDDWKELRLQASNSNTFDKEVEKCASQGGVLVPHEWLGSNIFNCQTLTKDAAKTCGDNKDCQGYCIAQYDGKWTSDIKGKCSKWVEPHGCYFGMKIGQMINNQICKE
jgi:hypothetical protein